MNNFQQQANLIYNKNLNTSINIGISNQNNNNQNINKSKREVKNKEKTKKTTHKNKNSSMNNAKSLKIMHWNCNSIKNKFKFLEQYLFDNDIDIISLNELKCEQELWNHICNMPRYNKVDKCRNNSGGGVSLLIKNNLEFEVIQVDTTNSQEVVGIKINSANEEIHIISWYIPEQTLSKDLIENLVKDKKNVLLMGDLNARTVQYNETTNNNGTVLDEYMINENMVYLNSNKDHTYYKFNSVTNVETKSVLDYFISNVELGNKCKNYSTLKFEILDSDHIPIYIELETEKPIKQIIENAKRNYKKTDWKSFRQHNDEREIITNDQLNKDEVDSKINELEENINWSLNISTPKFKKIINRQPLPENILKIIKLKNCLMKIFYNNRRDEVEDLIVKHLYYVLKNKIKEEIILVKNEIWQKELNSYNGQPLSSKRFWNKINKMRGLTAKSPIGTLKVEEKIFKTNIEKANLFKDRLKNTFKESNNTNFNDEYKKEVASVVNKYKEEVNVQTVRSITTGEFTQALIEITGKYTEDEYKISNGTIKQLSDQYKVNLLDIYNSLLKLNYIPDKWKVAKITMLPKTSNDSSNPKNYRPISITPSLMRLYEKIINNRIKAWLKSNNIIIKQQSGFRQNRQTKDNLFFLIEKINESMNRNRKSISIYFDIAAAFDKVWHDGLISKLIKINMEKYLINWVIEFLKDRQFFIVIEDFVSDKEIIECGVPQGAINSPILFSIYINDVPTNCKKNARYSLLFADDLAKLYIFKKICTDKTIEKEINNDLENLEKWFSKWRLEIATSKCMLLQHDIKNGQEKYKMKDIKITIYGSRIQREKETKFLGVKIDEKLNFASHIKKIESSCLNRVNILKILSHKSWKLAKTTLSNIYKTLVRSVIEYSSILFPLFKEEAIKKFCVIQNNCMRIISRVRLIDKMKISELENSCGIENLKKRMDTLRLRYIYKAVYFENPLIKEIMEDHNNYVGGRNVKHRSLFENVKRWEDLEFE